MEFILLAVITGSVFALVGRLPDPRKVKRELARARIQSIDSLADGKAGAVRGTVALIEPAALLVSPCTRKECVYYLVVVDEVGTGGDYHELGRFQAGRPFLLRSDHGTARVVPDRTRVGTLATSFTKPAFGAQGLLHLAQSFGARLKRLNYPATSWVRLTEYVLEPGVDVTIRGWCVREPDPEAADNVSGYREHLPTRPVLSGTRRANLLIG